MTMRSLFHKRMTAALLAVVMVLSLLPGQTARALAADPDDDVRGSISATLRIDYAQSLETLRDREVRVEVLRGSPSLGTVPLTAFEAGSLSGGSQVLHRILGLALTSRTRRPELGGYIGVVVLQPHAVGAGLLHSLMYLF